MPKTRVRCLCCAQKILLRLVSPELTTLVLEHRSRPASRSLHSRRATAACRRSVNNGRGRGGLFVEACWYSHCPSPPLLASDVEDVRAAAAAVAALSEV